MGRILSIGRESKRLPPLPGNSKNGYPLLNDERVAFICSGKWALSACGICSFFKLSLPCSMRPLSRVESGAKPPGESQRGLSPGPPPAPLELVERLLCGAALVAQGCSEFPLSAEATPRKIAALFLCRLNCSRTGWWERNGRAMREKQHIKRPTNTSLPLLPILTVQKTANLAGFAV